MSKSNIAVGTQGWANRINASWRRSAAAFIETGQLLVECKKTVPHGAWENMLATELDFPKDTAQRLMAIGRDARIAKPEFMRFLPPSYMTLYDLTKLPDDELEQALTSGAINPKMLRPDVPKKRKESPLGGAALDPRDPVAGDATPHDAVKGEDSGVTEQESDAGIAHGADRAPLADGAVHCTRSAPPDLEPNPERAAVVPVRDSGGGPASDLVAYWINPGDPMSRFANGLLMAMAASRELDFSAAASAWPEDMPLLADEITEFCFRLNGFDVQFRATWGAGNDAGLALP
jgi:hypothetical protein